jgi:hypothetical protein
MKFLQLFLSGLKEFIFKNKKGSQLCSSDPLSLPAGKGRYFHKKYELLKVDFYLYLIENQYFMPTIYRQQLFYECMETPLVR